MAFKKIAALGFAAILFLGATIAHAAWTLVTEDFNEQKGLTVNTWEPAEGLSFTSDSGKLDKVDTRNVLALKSDRAIAADGAGSAWRLSLRNGDILYGEPVKMTGQSLEFTMPELGKILVPLKVIAGLSDVHAAPAAHDNASIVINPEQDSVYTKTGDVTQGLILNVDAAKVQISTSIKDSAPTDFDMSNVSRITFGGTSPARSIPQLSLRLSFLSGSVLTVPLDAKQKSFTWTVNSIQLKDPAGQDRKASADTVADIDVVGGRVVWLTELDPVKDEQITFMGTRWPTEINKNVLGDPLNVLKKTYTRGLGVHTKSLLAYDLDGTFDTLKLRAAMDDSATLQGSANLSIVLDGKTIWEKKGLKGGELTEELALPIKGGKHLELHADPALADGKLDVLGRVDWLNAALIRQ